MKRKTKVVSIKLFFSFFLRLSSSNIYRNNDKNNEETVHDNLVVSVDLSLINAIVMHFSLSMFKP